MKTASKDYIINTVFRTNILPIISECNTACVFCSHRYNPSGVEVYRIPRLNLKDFEELLDFLSPHKKIVIGEAATRIIEGEPLLHREFLEIITMIRNRFKFTPIQITTNGILLTAELVDSLVRLGNIELNVSVNCVDEEKRERVLGLKKDRDISKKIELLKDKLKFSGSMVYVPELMNFEDIEEVIALLDKCGADSCRIFLPGVSSMAESIPDFYNLHNDMHLWLSDLRKKYHLPIVIEPTIIGSLSCNVEGIIKNSPSMAAGIKTGDIITEINGNIVRSRVDAFNAAFESSNPIIKILRGEESIELKLNKVRNVSPGFVVLYDIDTCKIDEIERVIERNLARKSPSNYGAEKITIWFLTSELAIGIIRSLMDLKDFSFVYRIISVKNRYFGGTIMCAGLMTVEDTINTLKIELHGETKPSLIVLPGIMFDYKGHDLTGRSIREIEEEFGIPVDII